MSRKLRNGDLVIGASGKPAKKCAWVYASGVLYSLNPLGRTMSISKDTTLPLDAFGQHVSRITVDIHELRAHVVPFYTTL